MYRGRKTNKLIVRPSAKTDDEHALSRGQIIVIFALVLTALIGVVGIAIDLSYTFIVEVRMQKAADAAALAGAVYLPDDPTKGVQASVASAKQNGYANKSGVTLDAHQDGNPEQMDVAITQSVPTFFMRIFGVNQMTPTRTAKAQFHLPVPMGSPLNVFGDPYAKDLSGNSLNFWASVNAPCTLKEQGDPYATKVTTASPHSNCNGAGKSNSEHKAPTPGDPGSYDYAVKVPTAGALTIQLYDPQFCARNVLDPAKGMNFDTGDSQWDDTNFTTTYTLYDQSDTPYDLTDDTAIASQSYPGDSKTTAGGSCSSTYVTKGPDPSPTPAVPPLASNYVGKWFTFATVGAGKSGTYRISVQTTAVGANGANATNQFAIKATLGGKNTPEVYAGLAGTRSAMSIFNNIGNGGKAYVYLANVGSAMAGKTMEVSLFDPGEINGNAYMSFIRPDGGTASFSWRDAGNNLGPGGATHANATSLQTANSGGGLFNGHWVVVSIKIPTTYTPGWWKIYYNMSATAHDRTTWRVEIQDNPVHLVQ